MEDTDQTKRTVDVTGLTETQIRSVEDYVAELRKPIRRYGAFDTYEEWRKAFDEWIASHKPVSHEVDWSRESIYEGRGE